MSVNKVILLGRLGDDIQVHRFPDGGQQGRASLATNESYKNKQGEKVKNTEWHNVTFPGKICEVVSKYFRKGDEIYIEGKLKTRKWEDGGITKYYTEVICTTFSFTGGTGQANQQQPHQGGFERTAPDSRDDFPF